MKKIFSLFLPVFLLLACNKGEKVEHVSEPKEDTSLNGVVVHLFQYDPLTYLEVYSDSTIIENLSFSFSFDEEETEAGVYYIMSNDSLAPSSLNMGLPVYLDSLGFAGHVVNNHLIIGGNEANEAYQKLREKLAELYQRYNNDLELLSEESESEAYQAFNEWESGVKYVYMEYFSNYLDSPLGEEIFLSSEFNAGDLAETDPEYIEKVLSYSSETFLSNPDVMDIIAIIEIGKR